MDLWFQIGRLIGIAFALEHGADPEHAAKLIREVVAALEEAAA